jgi:hypothetical protein
VSLPRTATARLLLTAWQSRLARVPNPADAGAATVLADPAAVAAEVGSAFVVDLGAAAPAEERAAAGAGGLEDEAPQPEDTPAAKTRTSDTSILPTKSTSRDDPLTREGYGVRKPARQRCL